jgi:NADPH:quinone reductase
MFGLLNKPSSIPLEMDAVEIYSNKGVRELRVVKKPIPLPRKNQVLIKMRASVLNPSDILYIKGRYGIESKLEIIPGIEGSGVVVAHGGGVSSKLLMGRRVACTPLPGKDGTWAQYMVTSVNNTIPLLPSISFEEGASLIVNPLSAWALYQRIKEYNPHSLFISAPSGALGTMLLRLGKSFGYNIITAVHKKEYLSMVKSFGPQVVLESWRDDFQERLKEVCHKHNCTVALDGIGGDMGSHLLKSMPWGSKIVVYGAMGGDESIVPLSSLIFSNISIEGFWLQRWASENSLFSIGKTMFQVQRKIKNDLKTNILKKIELNNIMEGFDNYTNQRTDGKILININT